MFRLLWSHLLVIMLLAGCGWNGTPTRENEFTPLTSIEIVASSPVIAAKTSTRLTVKGNFSGGFTRDVTNQAVWSSSTPAVAGFITGVHANRVTGQAPGTATITATVGNVSTTYNLTISNATITGITLTPAAPSIAKGRSIQFHAEGSFSDGSTQDLTFDATWASSTPSVASISDATDNSKGLARALLLGTTTISASFDGTSQSAELTVTDAVLDSLAVTTTQPSILSLARAAFRATGTLSDGTTTDLTGQATWASSQTNVATIGADGTATSLAQGTTSISATLNGISGSTSLKVTGGNLTSIAIKPVNPTMVKGTTLPITAAGTFSNGSTRDISSFVEWSVAAPAIANVSAPGGSLALLNAATETVTPTTVTAKVSSVTGTTNLTVTTLSVTSLAISPASLDLADTTAGRLKATATLSNGSTQDVTFSSTWSAVGAAAVGNTAADRSKGRVIGTGNGPATITATYGGQSATAPVTVVPRTIQSLGIGPASAVMTAGNEIQLSAVATYNGNISQDVTENVTWSVDDPKIAVFVDSNNQPGRIVAVDTGTTTVRATYGGKTATVTVSVGI